jgi:hypothetical protein
VGTMEQNRKFIEELKALDLVTPLFRPLAAST